MASRDDVTDAASRGERRRRQEQAPARSRPRRATGRRAPAPSASRTHKRASATGRRRPNSSDQTKGRPAPAATTTTAAAAKRANRPRASGRQAPVIKAGKRPTGPASRHERRRAAPTSHPRHGPLTELWQWLQITLRRLQRKLKRALATPEARKILTALLARRLPGPLRLLMEGLADPDRRDFLFWWLVVTLIVTLAIALLLSIVLAPVAGLVALLGVGVWMLIKNDRQLAAQRA